MKPLLCKSSVVRNLLNVEPNSWPPKAIDPTRPMQWQDRRICKPQPEIKPGMCGCDMLSKKVAGGQERRHYIAYARDFAPHKVGDILYVRESFMRNGPHIFYRADWPKTERLGIADGKWKPSLHMPKELSRIHHEVMRVRVEKACDISEDDARAEGVIPSGRTTTHAGRDGRWVPHVIEFQKLWQSIYGPESWNKWVWVLDFKRIK